MEHQYKNGYGYIRWSTDEQKDGNTQTRQQSAMERMATKLGISIVKIFIDDGISACKDKNNLTQEWFKLKSVLRKGDVVLVDNLDRITRRGCRTFYNTLGEVVEDIGAFIVICGEQQHGLVIDADNYETDWNIKISNAVASEGNKKKDYYCKVGIQSYTDEILNGKWNILPYRKWYWLKNDLDNKCFTIDETKANIVRSFFDLYNKGYSLRQITKEVNTQGIVSPGGMKWNYRTVYQYLSNKAVLGYGTIGGQEMKLFPPIVSEDTFYSIQQKLSDRKLYRGPAKYDRRINLFTSLAYCKKCGERFSFKARGKWIYLGCRSYTHGESCSGSVSYTKLEKSFMTLFAKSDILNKFLETSKQPTPLKFETLKLKLSEVQAKKDKIANVILNDEGPSKTLVEILKKTEIQELQLQKEVEYEEAVLRAANPLLSAFDKAIKNKLFDKMFSKESKMEVKELIRHVVDKIIIDKENRYEKGYVVYFKDNIVEPIDVVLGKQNYSINGMEFEYE